MSEVRKFSLSLHYNQKPKNMEKEFLVEVKFDKIVSKVLIIAFNGSDAVVKARKMYPNNKVFGAKERQ